MSGLTAIKAELQKMLGPDIGIRAADPEDVIYTPSEQGWLKTQAVFWRGRLIKQIFCMKESIYRTLYPLRGQVTEFREEEIAVPVWRIILADRPVGVHIETKTLIVGRSIFAHTNVSETLSPTTHSNRFK